MTGAIGLQARMADVRGISIDAPVPLFGGGDEKPQAEHRFTRGVGYEAKADPLHESVAIADAIFDVEPAALLPNEPPDPDVTDRRRVARVVIVEDGRVWLYEDLEEHRIMLPGGGAEPGETMQGAAIREAFEECGFVVRLDAWLGDYTDQHAARRYYRAESIAGRPTEADADGGKPVKLRLVPVADALVLCGSPYDRAVLMQLGEN